MSVALVPLTADEIKNSVEIIKSSPKFHKNNLFVSAYLREPSKTLVLKNISQPRIAEILLYNNRKNKTWKVQVLISNGEYKIIKWKYLPHKYPPQDTLNPPDAGLSQQDIAKILIKSSDVLKSLAKRDLNAEDLISGKINTFNFPLESLVNCKKLLKQCPEVLDTNKYRYAPLVLNYPSAQVDSLPLAWIDGLIIIVNWTLLKVYKVIDEYVTPLPFKVPDRIDRKVPSLKPLLISMPEGVSFKLSGNKLRWANWRMNISWHPRTGLQLYRIGYKDNSKWRSILYKMSINEANVYYNVDKPIAVRSFVSSDSDSYPLVTRAVSLVKGIDFPEFLPREAKVLLKGESLSTTFTDLIPSGKLSAPDFAQLIDIPIVRPDGSVEIKKDVIAIYEQVSDRSSYRSINSTAGNSPKRMTSIGSEGRQLVLKFSFSGLIYFWTFVYIFNTNGTIETRVDVSGRDLYMVSHHDTAWAELISKNNLAFNHTHIYNWRFDFDIDGRRYNQVVEENEYAILSPSKNSCGQAIERKSRILKTELEAARDLNIKTNRTWTIQNSHSTNRLGRPHGYQLLPIDANGPVRDPITAPYSWIHQHYSFINHHLHVTSYKHNEQFAAGNFPVMAKKDVGLGKYISRDENIDGKDIVVWYTNIFPHFPHTEDYPFVQTVSRGLQLVPHDFFESNPDVSLPHTK